MNLYDKLTDLMSVCTMLNEDAIPSIPAIEAEYGEDGESIDPCTAQAVMEEALGRPLTPEEQTVLSLSKGLWYTPTLTVEETEWILFILFPLEKVREEDYTWVELRYSLRQMMEDPEGVTEAAHVCRLLEKYPAPSAPQELEVGALLHKIARICQPPPYR